MIDPITGEPLQEPPQTTLGTFLGSPGMAMAAQAMQNLSALRRGQVPGMNPVEAFQRAQMQNEALMMRKARILDERMRNQAQVARMAQDMQIRQRELDQPQPITNPFANFPVDYQMYQLSNTDLPFNEWAAQQGTASQPAYVQEFSYGEQLRQTDPAAYQRFVSGKRAPTTIRLGPDGPTLLLDPSDPSKATAIGPEGYETVDEISTYINERAAERKRMEATATQGVQMAGDLFGQIETIDQAVRNMQSAIRAIDAGAGTGVIERHFPSIRASSVELDNIRNRMGLDIVGQGSFGALSESELDFALSTALPEGLDGPELRDWLNRKIESQEKLRRELSDAAIFFGSGGGVAEFIERKRKRQSDDGTVREL